MKLNLINTNFIFRLGVFFLATAPFISAILFIPCIVSSFLKNRRNIFKDKFNIPFLFGMIIIVLSAIKQYFLNTELISQGWDRNLSFIVFFNWIPFLLFFISFQDYLKDKKSRETIALCLITGSIPVLISVILQVFLGIHGPFSTLNGLIVWYQRPMEELSATGIFNNPNYLASWLLMVIPFSLSFISIPKLSRSKKFFWLIINSFFSMVLILSMSRNGISGLFLTFLLTFYRKLITLNFLIISFAIILILIAISFFIGNISNLYFINEPLFSSWQSILNEFNDSTRIDIWKKSIAFIFDQPLFGIGPGAFPLLYEVKGNLWGRHAHNLFLDLSLNYGLIASISIFIGFLLLIFRSSQNEKISDNDKAWRISAILFLYVHLFDVTYYDGRISALCWIVFAGLRSMEREKEEITSS